MKERKMGPCKGTETYIDNGDGTITLQIRGKKHDGDVIFSKEDLEKIQKHHWYIKDKDQESHSQYVATKIKESTIKLHRFILDIYEKGNESKIVDHINRNTLDNRRENLRIVSYSENNHNHKMNKNNTSGRKGLKYMTPKNRSPKWRAQIIINGKEYRKDFSISVYGDDAKKKAIEQREKWENEFNILSEKEFND